MAEPRSRAPESGRLTLTVLPRAARIMLGVLGCVLVVIAALELTVTGAYIGREGHSASGG